MTMMPKVELHCHLDGSLRLETIIARAKAKNYEGWPADMPRTENAVEELREKIVAQPGNLEKFLLGFKYIVPMFKGPRSYVTESIQKMARDLCEDVQKIGMRYIEVRFAPILMVDTEQPSAEQLTVDEIVELVDDEFVAFRRHHSDPNTPAVVVRQIVCVLTFFSDEQLELSYQAAKKYSHQPRAGGHHAVVGIDVAGPAGPDFVYDQKWVDFYQRAKSDGINRTAHAGENSGWASVKDAVDDMSCQRVGHGYHILDEKVDPESKLLKEVVEKDIILEMCPISSFLTGSALLTDQHPARILFDRQCGSVVTINSDDPTIVNGHVDQDIAICQTRLGLTEAQIWTCQRNAYRARFDKTFVDDVFERETPN